MKKKQVRFLKELLETPSATGTEIAVARLVRERLADTADEVRTDVMGSVHAMLKGAGAGPSLMLSAHMDEIGLMVTYISDEGYLSVASVGGVDAAVLPGMRVDVHASESAEPLRGVVGRKPIHLIEPDERKKVTPLDKLVIDLGLPGKKVRKLVRVGDVITFGVGFERFGAGMAVSRSTTRRASGWACACWSSWRAPAVRPATSRSPPPCRRRSARAAPRRARTPCAPTWGSPST